MPAALAHEQHHPIVRRGDEAMSAAKPPRCVYDRGRQSNLRLETTTFGDVHHRQDDRGKRRAADGERKDAVSCGASPGSAYSAVIASQNGFSAAQRV
jgi:hypothetical protein